MLSNRIILIFLGIIFLIIIILSSQRLSGGLKSRLSGLFPGVKPIPTVSPTPTPFRSTPTPTRTQTAAGFAQQQTKGGQYVQNGVSEIPSTGADVLSLGLLASLGSGGIILKKLTSRPS
ncbi:hypothetical protein A2773_05570 [Candidatus Gottesmanbacteria bacterium RIFCSPHIGHO2_01_FULL_39_10]|uniref:Uncharacterized protein n=1 Tax=Candidatus Gottesmanbacteria bacterium RIFCSPHIGHO2_01_FULL_39_10 TaxID=1798375 RepID=A0A1F5ZPY2_9BACT|nr:MAG: hypothetical protein A2773_05570 [Candidatus Gottesmanbacteria bacterium RIFCSPHIGHO2_01_FULL_39_10]